MKKASLKGGAPSARELVDGVLKGDRGLLARAITLVESRSPRHEAAARELMTAILPHTGGSTRVGLTGTPGAGKSTFIESLGLFLCRRGHRVAVLAVDPSSSRSGGSILGDKTRMEELSRDPNAFIRPSPSGGTIGGVAARTREALHLCEAAGYDVVLVETVGVGQSETAVRTMTDFFLLLQITGAGDDLQGIKKGVIELADAILVTKADGDNRTRAQQARVEYEKVLHFLDPFTPGWQPRVMTCSALQEEGVSEVWEMVLDFRKTMEESGVFQKTRKEQNLDWFRSLLSQTVMARFRRDHALAMREIEAAVASGEIPVFVALDRLFHS